MPRLNTTQSEYLTQLISRSPHTALAASLTLALSQLLAAPAYAADAPSTPDSAKLPQVISSSATNPGSSSAVVQSIDLPPQPLTDALRALGKTTDTNILIDPNLVKDIQAPAVRANLTADQALTRLLAGTGIRHKFIDEHTVVLSAIAAKTTSNSPLTLGERVGRGQGEGASSRSARNASAEGAGPSPPVGEGGEKGKSLRLTQANSTAGADSSSAEDESSSSSKGLPEILVKGLHSLNVDLKRDPDGTQPYIAFDSEDIRRSGAPDINTFLRDQLPSLSVVGSPASTPSAQGNLSVFNLRGLGTDQTLILINGRRTAGANFLGNSLQPDLNAIPLTAIERIEILPSTASGMFGGGATGGVINVILRENYSGMDVDVTYGNTFDNAAAYRKVSLAGGFNLENNRTHVLLSASYSTQDDLLTGDRDFISRERQFIAQTDPAALFGPLAPPPLGATTNIKGFSPLTLKPVYGGAVLPSNITYIPYGYAGQASDSGAALIANSGHYNLDLANTEQAAAARGSLLNFPTIESASASIRREFSDRLELFAEVSASENAGRFDYNPVSATYALPASAPGNPFNQTVLVSTPAFGLDGQSRTNIRAQRMVVGAIANLDRDWTANLDYTWSATRYRSTTPNFLLPPGLADIQSGALDVFRDTNAFPVSFAPYASPDDVTTPVTSTITNPAIRVGGPLPILLPGGVPTVTMTLEYHLEQMGDTYQTSGDALSPGALQEFYYPKRHQSVASVYLETRLPLFSARNSVPGMRELEVQIAARRDDYHTTGANIVDVSASPPGSASYITETTTSTNPTFSLKYQPIADLTFRGSYATGFLPPNVTQLVPGTPFQVPGSLASQLGITDPRRGNEPLSSDFTFLTGGGPNLRPELARSWSIGVILTPRILSGLRLSLDRTVISKTDDITFFDFGQDLVNNELSVSGLVTRSPATPANDPNGYGVGPIVVMNGGLINASKARTAALDAVLDYSWDQGPVGRFAFTARGTHSIEKTTQVSPLTPPISYSGTAGYQSWRANAALSWELHGWTAEWRARYTGAYYLNTDHSVVPTQGAASVPSQIYYDASIGYQVGEEGGQDHSVISGLTLLVGARNILNTRPPIVVTNLTGVSEYGDPSLGTYFVNLRKAF